MRGLSLTNFKRLLPYMAAGLLLLVIVLCQWLPQSSFYARKKEMTFYLLQETALAAGLRLNEVYVRGRDKTAQKDLLAALNVQRGMPLTAVDIQEAREKIQRLPWIKTVHIERRLPHILYVSVTERTPIAVYQRNGEYRPVDQDGQIIETQVRSLKGLPLVLGADAPEKTPDLLKFLDQEPALRKRVKAASRIGRRRWDILLDDFEKGTKIKLPEKDPAGGWNRLAKLDRTQNILKQGLEMIDLRFPDKVPVHPKKRGTDKKSAPEKFGEPKTTVEKTL